MACGAGPGGGVACSIGPWRGRPTGADAAAASRNAASRPPSRGAGCVLAARPPSGSRRS